MLRKNIFKRAIMKDAKTKINKVFPVKIRLISLSLALFMLGRGLGTDTYFSIYIKEIVGNARGVTAIGTILAVVKLIFVIPIGRMNDRMNMKYILLMGKALYVVCGLLFFLAGIYHSWILLIFATILNGFANATTFTTYRSYYAKKTTKADNTQISGIYFSSMYITEVIGSLIAAVLVNYLELPYMYFFVVIFALVSLLQDQKIKIALSKKCNKTWKKFYIRVKKESKYVDKLDEGYESDLKFFGKEGFIRSFLKECLSVDSWREIWIILHKYSGKLYVALGSCTLTNFLNYTSFLFIPIISVENNLSLSQIALVFAAMKLPYVVNVFTGKFGDKYSKKLLISIILVLMSFLYVALGFSEKFSTILILTFFISLGVAMLSPLSAALVISYTHPKDKGSMTGVQDFVSRLGDIVGSLGFGTLTAIIGLNRGFIITGLCLFGLGGYLMIKKLVSYRGNNEREKIKSSEIYELPVPAVDVVSEVIKKK